MYGGGAEEQGVDIGCEQPAAGMEVDSVGDVWGRRRAPSVDESIPHAGLNHPSTITCRLLPNNGYRHGTVCLPLPSPPLTPLPPSPLTPLSEPHSLRPCAPLPLCHPESLTPTPLPRLAQRGAFAEALSLARRHEHGPHFMRSLEWLLFTTLEMESSHKPVRGGGEGRGGEGK